MAVVGIVVKKEDNIALFPVWKVDEIKSELEPYDNEVKLLPSGDFVVIKEKGKIRFEKLERVQDDPDVKTLMFRYLPRFSS